MCVYICTHLIYVHKNVHILKVKGSINFQKLSISVKSASKSRKRVFCLHRYLELEDLHRLCTIRMHYIVYRLLCFVLFCFHPLVLRAKAAFTRYLQGLLDGYSSHFLGLAFAFAQAFSSVPFVSGQYKPRPQVIRDMQISLG